MGNLSVTRKYDEKVQVVLDYINTEISSINNLYVTRIDSILENGGKKDCILIQIIKEEWINDKALSQLKLWLEEIYSKAPYTLIIESDGDIIRLE